MNAEEQGKQSNYNLYVILGAIIGAVTGASAGYLLVKRIEEGDEFQLTAGDGIKLGGTIIAFLRQVSTLGK
jgi:16S rRNA U1498 N3-methylase RsmE